MKRVRDIEKKTTGKINGHGKKCLERQAKWHVKKLALQVKLERLQFERAVVQRESFEARSVVQSAASSQAGQKNVIAFNKTL